MEHEIRISSLILIISIFCGTMLFSVNMQYFDVRALYLFYISTALIYILYNQGELNIQPHVSCESIKKAFFGIKCLILIFLLVLLVFKTKNIWNNFQGNNLLFNLETLRAGRNPALYKPDIFEEKNSGLFADKQFYEKYSKALILCPENLIARKRYISFIIADSRFDRALKLIDQFVKCAPFFGDIINLQALVFYKTGHYIKAGENFLNYAVKIPFNESAYMNALFSFMEAKSYEQALKTIEYAKKRAPNSAANSPEAGKTRAFLKNLEPFEKKVKAELKIN
jgi:tetratricopeptide (TPR) repeat protein